MVLDAHDRWHPLGFTRLCKLMIEFAKCDGVLCGVSKNTWGSEPVRTSCTLALLCPPEKTFATSLQCTGKIHVPLHLPLDSSLKPPPNPYVARMPRPRTGDRVQGWQVRASRAGSLGSSGVCAPKHVCWSCDLKPLL